MADKTGQTGNEDRQIPDWLHPFVVVAVLVAVMWAVEIVDLLPGVNLDRFGIRPRTLVGLRGIVFAPFLHNGVAHVLSNTVPFLVLGWLIAASGTQRFVQVTVLVAVVGGVGTWLTGSSGSIHIGASGLVFGYLTYLLARAVFEKKVLYLIGGAVVLFLYGGVLWGLVPRPGISWQGHLFGALGGIVAARMLHSPGERSLPGAEV
ncbi:MAG: rhomboid family intramembrane serine protease [Acidimicrobiales bacterium]|nr:rhomboid family intramembrane serine protease [Acidimicrobiales bacterium]